MWRWIGTSSGAERSWPNPKLWSNRNQPSMLVNHDEPMNAWIIFFAQNTFTCVTLRFADTTTGNWDMDGYGLKVSQSPNKQMHGLIMFKHLKWTQNFFGYWITPKHKIHTVYIYRSMNNFFRWTSIKLQDQQRKSESQGSQRPVHRSPPVMGWRGWRSDFIWLFWREVAKQNGALFSKIQRSHWKKSRKNH